MIPLVVLVLSAAAALAAPAAWPQWGGPERNFVAPGSNPASRWPDGGPRRVWQRPLGDGFSAIVSDGRAVYTVYRSGENDVAVAMDAETGRTLWEAAYAAPFHETCSERLGAVPRAAPLVDGDRLVTVSSGGRMHSLDKSTGRELWTHDLLEAVPDAVRACGYSSSPLAFGGTIITTAGGKGRGVIALNSATGRTVWQSQDFQNGYSSPILIDLDGRPELIVFTFSEVAGLDPKTGALEWMRPHEADQGVNVATPIWGPDHLLFVSSAYNGGSRVLRLTREGAAVRVDEVWANKRVRIHFGNAVRLGKRIYASNGDFGAAPFAAVDVETGDMVWRDRSVSRSTVLGAGGKLVILDEDGNLAVAEPGDAGLNVLAKAHVLENRAWTVPTLCGNRLFLRDRKVIVALDLGT